MLALTNVAPSIKNWWPLVTAFVNIEFRDEGKMRGLRVCTQSDVASFDG